MKNTRDEILTTLRTLLDRYPDMRFGQLVVNISNWASGVPDSLWDLEDEQFLGAAKEHLKRTNAPIQG